MKPLALICLLATSTFAAEHRAANATDLANLTATAKPGDVILLADGDWNDARLKLTAKGAADQPITIRAATPGKTVFTGESSIELEGEHLILSGLSFNDCTSSSTAITVKSSHTRITECAVTGGKHKFHVHLFGKKNRLDHCYLAGKTNEGPTLQIDTNDAPNEHLVDHNHFGPRPPLRQNGGETIRIGYSHQQKNNSRTIVEHNLFDKCDGEIEIISSKSCENIYRHNSFIECAGMLTLRHGDRCTIDGNFFIGRGKRGSGGVRVIGEDHVVINNYIEGVTNGGFWITSGAVDPPAVGYIRSKNALIAFNTVVNSKGPCVELDAGIGSSNRTLRPEKITLAHNIFIAGEGGTLIKRENHAGYTWKGNFAPEANGIEGVTAVADMKLERGKDDVLRPADGSPARGAATADFPQVKVDIDAQPREGKRDAGCDQSSTAEPRNRVLKPKDVGPAWLAR